MGKPFKDIVDDVRNFAVDAIRKVDLLDLVGEEKLERAIDLVSEKVDEAIRLPAILEPFDGAIVRAIARFILQLVFNELRTGGQI